MDPDEIEQALEKLDKERQSLQSRLSELESTQRSAAGRNNNDEIRVSHLGINERGNETFYIYGSLPDRPSNPTPGQTPRRNSNDISVRGLPVKETREEYRQLRDQAAREYRSRLSLLGEVRETEANFIAQARQEHQAHLRTLSWTRYLENRRLLESGELNDRATSDLRRKLEIEEIQSIRRNDIYAELLVNYEIMRYGAEEAHRRMQDRLFQIEMEDTHGNIDIDRQAHLRQRLEARHSAVAGPFAAIGQIVGTYDRRHAGEQYDPAVHTNDDFMALGAAIDGLIPDGGIIRSIRRNGVRATSNWDRILDPREYAHGAPLEPLSRGLTDNESLVNQRGVNSNQPRYARTLDTNRAAPAGGRQPSSAQLNRASLSSILRERLRKSFPKASTRKQEIIDEVIEVLDLSRIPNEQYDTYEREFKRVIDSIWGRLRRPSRLDRNGIPKGTLSEVQVREVMLWTRNVLRRNQKLLSTPHNYIELFNLLARGYRARGTGHRLDSMAELVMLRLLRNNNQVARISLLRVGRGIDNRGRSRTFDIAFQDHDGQWFRVEVTSTQTTPTFPNMLDIIEGKLNHGQLRAQYPGIPLQRGGTLAVMYPTTTNNISIRQIAQQVWPIVKNHPDLSELIIFSGNELVISFP